MVAGAAFKCPSCGAPLTLRFPGFSETIVCGYCQSILDAKDPQHKILSRYKSAVTIEPKIPIGTKGTIRGEKFEVIGFMKRKVRYDCTDYAWSEYLLYNPYKGYRWLMESDGHWNFYTPITEAPKEKWKGLP